MFEIFTMAWRAPWLSLFSPPPVRRTGHQVKVWPCQCVRRNIRHGSSAHAYTPDIFTLPAPRVLCVRVCVGKHKLRDCEWKRAWTSTDENTDHSRTPVSPSPLCKSVSPFQPCSLPPSHYLTHSLIRMKTHLQSAGTKNQLVTPPSHYDNWVLWASCKAPKHTPSSSDACWLSSLSHTCTVIHFTAEQTSLGSIQTFILTKWCMLSHICSIRDAMVLYVLGSRVRHGSVPHRILLPLSHGNWLHKNSVLRECCITHFTFFGWVVCVLDRIFLIF